MGKTIWVNKELWHKYYKKEKPLNLIGEDDVNYHFESINDYINDPIVLEGDSNTFPFIDELDYAFGSLSHEEFEKVLKSVTPKIDMNKRGIMYILGTPNKK